MIRNTLFVLLSLMCIPGVMNAAPSNLFDFNGDFSRESAGSGKVPSGWVFSNSPTVRMEITEEVPPESGLRKSLTVDWSRTLPADQSRMFLSDFIPVDPALPHIQKVWIKTDGKTEKGFGVTVGRMFYDKDKKLIAYDGYLEKRYFLRNAGPTDWTLFSQTLAPQRDKAAVGKDEIPENTAYARILFLSYGYNKNYRIAGHVFRPYLPGEHKNFRDASIVTMPPSASFPAPKVDGIPDDPVWQNPETVNSGFVRTICNRKWSVPVKAQTSFRLFQDRDNLYFAVHCKSADPDRIKAEVRPPNDTMVFGDEEVELFLDGTGKRERILQIGLNAAGSYAVRFNNVPVGLPLRYAVRRTADGWTGELAIPREKIWQLYSEANCELNPDAWNINVCRHQPSAAPEERYSSWNATGQAFSSPRDMGILLFSTPRKALQTAIETAAAQTGSQLKQAALPEHTDSAALNRTLAEIRSTAAIPAWLLRQLATTSELSPSAFAEYYSEAIAFPSIVRDQVKSFRRLNFAFPRERQKYGCLLASVPLLDPVSEESLPNPDAITSKLSIRAAGDEIAFVRFRVFAGQNLRNMEIRWSQFTDGKGNAIPDSSVDVRILQPWGKNHQADILATDLRIPFAGYLKNYAGEKRFIPEIAANTSRDILVGVRISPEQTPGTYTGKVTLAPEGVEASVLEVSAEALPFRLLRTEKDVGFFSSMVLFDPQGPAIGSRGAMFYNGRETEKSFVATVRMVTDSGFNFLVQPVYSKGPFQPEHTRQILKLCREGGLSRISLLGAEHIITPDLFAVGKEDIRKQKIELLTERLREAVDDARALGFEKCYIYGSDEPHTPIDILRNDAIFAAAKKVGGSTLVACILESVRVRLKDMDAVMMNYLAMTTSANPLIDAPPAGLRRLYYANMTNEFDPVCRMAFGWYLEKSEFDGNVPWALYYLGPDWDPFKDFALTGELSILNATYVFPTADQPIPTLKFIAASAGVGDLRYIETLKAEMKRSAHPAARKNAEAELKKMLELFEVYNPQGTRSNNFKITPAQYDQFRDRLQTLILTL